MTNLNPNSSYSLSLTIELPNIPGTLSNVTQAIAGAGGSFEQIFLIKHTRTITQREITVDASSEGHAEEIVAAVREIPNVKILKVSDRTFDLHSKGKITVTSRISIKSKAELAMAYTPGVGRICNAITRDYSQVFNLTIKQNTVAVVTDGSAVLGLGNLGPEAALPVMEGKAMLFKEFADINAFPICLATQDTEEIIETVKRIIPVFGGVNLEDIAAPRCFEIERRLRQELEVPIFHDDQHGTAIVSLAALINALKIVKKSLETVRIVINGAGAAGIAIAALLRTAGATTILLCDSKGLISHSRTDLTPQKQEFAVDISGSLVDAMQGADVFLGVSAPGVVTPEMIKSMSSEPIVFAMANPIPEIQPELVNDDVAVMATGRSDYPNQINNVLAFPGIFRGALDSHAKTITEYMCLEAAKAIASLVNTSQLEREYIIPSVFDERVCQAVAKAVCRAARQDKIISE
ncbi:malic enzyme-like NAD(P)-binding protein [Cyanobacterium sp. uoEpiScrs1]|uniref:malic enzyme-like NAD(P)-binding protein n=1 Tax=Cyanobacterium sp. uoEpiScrs1 TaxID=2976343 RepID=UPI00226A6438|nr:malic enzyme-like NAD(P)-binding protein [Cyanobacterium sp. uoEpiScrs1]